MTAENRKPARLPFLTVQWVPGGSLADELCLFWKQGFSRFLHLSVFFQRGGRLGERAREKGHSPCIQRNQVHRAFHLYSENRVSGVWSEQTQTGR
jgi:hypothetical protein